MNFITSKPVCSIVPATRELVDSLLALNTRNRALRPSVVKDYVRYIKLGHWLITNQGIGVSQSGVLVDGQHRLEAIKAAGYPVGIQLLVVTGLSELTMAAVDAGTNRSARDFLTLFHNTRVSSFSAAVVRTLLLAGRNFSGGGGKFDAYEYAEAFSRYAAMLAELLTVAGMGKLPAAVVAALVDLMSKGYSEETIAFAKALTTGEMLGKDHPALVLRNFLQANTGHGGTQGMIERFRKTQRALAAFIEDRPITRLYGAAFPTFKKARRGDGGAAASMQR